MPKTLRQLAANPNYMTGIEARQEYRKAADAFNDYMTRSVNGRTGFEWHEEYQAEMRKLMKEKDPKTKETGLKDLALGERFGKHVARISELVERKNYWDRICDQLGSSNAQIMLKDGIMPAWMKRLKDPHFDDPELAQKEAAGRVVFGYQPPPRAGRLDVARGGNELYKGLAT